MTTCQRDDMSALRHDNVSITARQLQSAPELAPGAGNCSNSFQTSSRNLPSNLLLGDPPQAPEPALELAPEPVLEPASPEPAWNLLRGLLPLCLSSLPNSGKKGCRIMFH